MAYQRDSDAAGNVPTFSFTLPRLDPTSDIPQLFNSPTAIRKQRKPGFLTNVQKSTVYHLLQVFRPEDQTYEDTFDQKKRLVTNAIHAIYQLKQDTTNNKTIASKQKEENVSKQFQRSDGYLYRTPSKSKRGFEESTENTRVSSSQSKLNYSRSEQKFKEEQIMKLRKRAGIK